jgi:ATP-dependent Clp protease ATP-binding subunit ClpA
MRKKKKGKSRKIPKNDNNNTGTIAYKTITAMVRQSELFARDANEPIELDPDLISPKARDFQEKLGKRIVGQDRAVRRVCQAYQMFLAGMTDGNRPIANLLLLGPTGSGKTRIVEAAAEVLFNDPLAVMKIDCAEFQHSHQIAKLIGSPPGYLGHRETSAMLTQENLDRFHTPENRLTFVLFDEIEKASDSLWGLLLGIMDKATLTLGCNRRVDFSKTMIFLTSNLGSREISTLTTGGIGFVPKSYSNTGSLDQKIYRTGTAAAQKRFPPEFSNRIDKTIVFRSLNETHLKIILELELKELQNQITKGSGIKLKEELAMVIEFTKN